MFLKARFGMKKRKEHELYKNFSVTPTHGAIFPARLVTPATYTATAFRERSVTHSKMARVSKQALANQCIEIYTRAER